LLECIDFFNDNGKKSSQSIVHDEAFMARLLKDATTVLAEEGIVLPEGMEVKAVQNAEKLTYLVVPPKPSRAISETDLDSVSGGIGSDYRCNYNYIYGQIMT
jgi:hypothetical protein